MKKILLSIFMFSAFAAGAQTNIVKWNAFGMFLGNISLQYERTLNEPTSVALGLSKFTIKRVSFCCHYIRRSNTGSRSEKTFIQRICNYSWIPLLLYRKSSERILCSTILQIFEIFFRWCIHYLYKFKYIRRWKSCSRWRFQN